jgi:hypothetical protein
LIWSVNARERGAVGFYIHDGLRAINKVGISWSIGNPFFQSCKSLIGAAEDLFPAGVLNPCS